MKISQRQATIFVLGFQLSVLILLWLSQLFAKQGDAFLTLGAGLASLAYATMLFAYLRGWEYARHVSVVLITLLVAAFLPEPFVSTYAPFLILLGPVLALVLVNPLWVIGSAIATVGLLLVRAGGVGVYADPTTLLSYALVMAGLVASRAITETARSQASQAEDALRVSEARKAAVLESALDCIITIDQHGHILEFNPAAEATFGYSRAEALGREMAQLIIPPSLRDEHRRGLTRYLITKESHILGRRIELTGLRADGSEFPVELTVTRMSEDEPPVFTGFARDITDRKKSEEKSRLSDQILERANTLVLVADSQGNITYVSPAVKTILGYELEELLGDKWWKVSRSESAHAQREKEYVGRAEITIEGEAYERPIQEKWGNTHWISWVDAAGPGNTLIGVGHDITERKHAEEALRKSEQVMRQAESLTHTGSWEHDLVTGKIFNTGKNLRLFFGDDHSKGGPFEDYSQVVHPDDRDFVMRRHAELLEGGPGDIEYRVVWPDGSIHVVFGRATVVRDESGQAIRAYGTNLDITERLQTEEKIKLQVSHLNALHEIDQAINASVDLRVALDVFLRQTVSQLKVDAAAILLFNPDALTLEYAAVRGFQVIPHTEVRLDESYAGKAILERNTIHISNFMQADIRLAQSSLFENQGFVDFYAVPLIAKGDVKGVLEIFHRAQLNLEQNRLDFLETLAGQAAIAINNAQLFEDLQRSNTDLTLAYDATIEGWSRAMDLRDRATEGHTLRVTNLTMELAHAMNISASDLMHIRRGALLHDIGKLGVPDYILLKPGKLTDEEWEIMRKHPTHAYEMLSRINYLRPALDIPYAHHEKWDGSGYPRGLQGQQIPQVARLFAVVDVWDAVTSDRPYRSAWSKEQAHQFIKEQSGKHFDPQVVEVFLKMIADR